MEHLLAATAHPSGEAHGGHLQDCRPDTYNLLSCAVMQGLTSSSLMSKKALCWMPHQNACPHLKPDPVLLCADCRRQPCMGALGQHHGGVTCDLTPLQDEALLREDGTGAAHMGPPKGQSSVVVGSDRQTSKLS